MKYVYQLMSYGVGLNTSDYCVASKRRSTLRNYCLKRLTEKEVVDFARLNRVAQLLRLSEPEAIEQLVLVAKEMGTEDVLTQSAERLLQCSDDQTTAQICYVLVQNLNTSTRNVDTLHLQRQLASKAATYCSNECLMDVGELCRLVSLRYLILKRAAQVGSSPDAFSSLSSLGVYQDFTTPILNRDIMKHLSAAQARILPVMYPVRNTCSIVGLSTRIPLSEAADALREFARECLSVIHVLRGCRQLMPALYMAYMTDSLVQLLFSELPNLDAVTAYNKTITKHCDELASQLLIRVMTANRPDVPDMGLATSCLLNLGPDEGYKNLGILIIIK